MNESMTPYLIDRRKDSPLRSAIDRIRQDISLLSDKITMSTRIIEELCFITESPIGLALELSETSGVTHLKVIAHLLKNNPPTTPLDPLTIDRGLNLLKPVIAQNKAHVFLGAQLERFAANTFCWPPLKQMLAIPMVDHEGAYGVICLCNSAIPYHVDIAKRCRPLITTVTCMRRLFNSQSNRYMGEQPWCSTLLDVEKHSPTAMVSINHDFKITRANPAAEKLFHLNLQKALNLDISKLIPERFKNEHRIHEFNVANIQNGVEKSNLKGRLADGTTFPISVTPIRYYTKGQSALLLVIEDGTEIEAIKIDQRTQTQRFKVVSDLAPIGILQTDAQWEACYVNSRWCDICGCAKDDILGMGWINPIHHEDISTFLTKLREDIIEGREFSGEYRFMTPLGDTAWVAFQARPLLDPNGSITGFIATLTDITYRRMTEQKLRKMAENDTLTGLANRALFQDRLDHAIQRVDRHGPFALLCLDLDGFKNINDTLGHDSGDLLLVEVSKRLLDCVRANDTVARVGGDEFMVIMEGLDDASVAANVAQKILLSLQQPVNLSNQEVFISTSIGITFAMGQSASSAQNLIKQADIALYRAKAEGRNNFQYFSPELEEASKNRLLLGNSLYRALERTEFEVFYQLQLSTVDNTPKGCEALLRWRHPEKGLLSPDEFIPLLEESGLIGPVSRWLWYQAFADHKRWIDDKLLCEEAHVSINLSPRQLRDPQFLRSFETAMNETGLSGHHVVIEITESVLLEDTHHTVETLRSLKNLGIRIALDDFGTGYSSLTYLKKFAIDIIKIDQTFIRDILSDPEDAAITQAVLALTKSLYLKAVAEGVDTKDKLELLAKWQCDMYQGYHINKPCPAADIESLLTQ